jgi:acetolactate synthase-1/2/3 large subunit
MMQAFDQKAGQVIVTDKGLASMGYGLAGAIGAALSSPNRRTILVEGDGGFSQNLQEMALLGLNHLNLKIFLFANEGYASIRMTQRNYFDGNYLGCDTQTGLGFPSWEELSGAYGIESMSVTSLSDEDRDFETLWNAPKPALFVVRIHPEQTYFPKISSRVRPDGGMESAPLDLMTPDLPSEIRDVVMKFS